MKKSGGLLKMIFVAAAACLIYGVASGIRANYGLMLGALVASSGVDYASVSFVLAVAQLMVGLVQPLAGMLALRKSNAFVLCAGAALMAVGLIGIPYSHSLLSLLFFLGLLLAGGTGAMSFGVIMGTVTPVLGEKRAAVVSGFVSASSGLGGTILSPLMQSLIDAVGLRAMLLFLCALVIPLIPVSLWLSCVGGAPAPGKTGGAPLTGTFRRAIRDRGYLHIFLAFFTCGFHMAIIETHLFSQYTSYGFSETLVAFAFSVYGAGATLGCILTGFLDMRFDNRRVLGGTYASRILIASALLLLPKRAALVYVTAFFFGLSGNATVPPTSGLITKLYGPAHLAALFGTAFLVHQVGSFCSSWLGGVSAALTGGYALIWCVSMALSAGAAWLSLTIPVE